MTPGAILALIRDALIVGGIGAVLWFVWHATRNADDLKDLKASLHQVEANQATEGKWREEQSNATTEAAASLAAFNTKLDTRPPILVRIPASGPPLPHTPASTGTDSSHPGPAGPGCAQAVQPVDVRPVLDPFERKYATALIECQKLYEAWPH